ncbi:MAG: nucleotide-binding protein [Planctomycetes bacterium]|nr:nucleotide-binding protein [Planctomycetota bacterium]
MSTTKREPASDANSNDPIRTATCAVDKQIEEGEKILNRFAGDSNSREEAYLLWDDRNEFLLKSLLSGIDLSANYCRRGKSMRTVRAFLQRETSEDLRSGIIELRRIRQRIELNELPNSPSPRTRGSVDTGSKKVFVVHGHDDEMKITVARFLEKLGLDAIILHEQLNQGRAVFEKLEDYADITFAVVLLSPDDEGRDKNGDCVPSSRARQNVILELGYFWGTLGRPRVFLLLKNSVKWPSDYHGIIYEPFDAAGAWKQRLAKELAAAGVSFDSKKLLTS